MRGELLITPIHGELLKLGVEISQATVSKYMARYRKPPSQTWRTFLNNHAKDVVAIDFFTAPTATFRFLYVFVMLSHDRRHVIHFNVTANPTAAWAAQQLVEAFPWNETPQYLLRDTIFAIIAHPEITFRLRKIRRSTGLYNMLVQVVL